jgi:hypothetical protein
MEEHSMSAMKDLHMALADALGDERTAAQHGFTVDVPKFVNDLDDAGYVIVPRSALTRSLTRAPAVTPEVIHREFDIAELKTSYRVLLNKHLVPLLEDALSAVEIGVPAVAARRIKLAIEMAKRFSA